MSDHGHTRHPGVVQAPVQRPKSSRSSEREAHGRRAITGLLQGFIFPSN